MQTNQLKQQQLCSGKKASRKIEVLILAVQFQVASLVNQVIFTHTTDVTARLI